MRPLAFLLRLFLTGKLALAGTAVAEEPAEGRESLTWSVEAILADPAQIDIFDTRFVAFCRENRESLLPGLKASISKQRPADRILISRLLLELGDGDGSAILLEGLQSKDEDHLRGTLVALSGLPWRRGRGLTVPLDQDEALLALHPFLGHENPHFRKLAAGAVFRLSLPAAVEQQRALLEHPDPALRKLAALQRAAYQRDPAAWPVLRSLLAKTQPGDFHDRYHIVHAMAHLCESDDPALRDAVVLTATAEIEMQLNKTDNDTSNEVSNLLKCLEASRSPSEAKLLERVIASGLEDWTRRAALARLARIEGKTGVARLSDALGDGSLRDGALTALAEQGLEIATPELVEEVRRILGRTDDQTVRGLALDALLAMGASDDPAIREQLDKLDPIRRFETSAGLRGHSAAEMLRVLTAAALATEDASASAEAFAESWQSGSKWNAVLELLHESRRLEAFDTEDGFVPPNYVGLLHGFAEIAEPDVAISEIALRPEVEEGKHAVSLRLDGRPLDLLVDDLGDWFDLASLLAGLNRGLAEGGSPLRFVVLYTGGQTAIVIFGNGERIQDLAVDYAFPLAADPDEAMRAGQEYERRVIEDLQQQN